MVDNKIQDEMISAYLDGELTAGERAQVAQWIENDPRARNVYQELQQLRESLRSLPSVKFDKNLTQTILEQIDTPVATEMMVPSPETEYAVAASAACYMDASPAAMAHETDETSADKRVAARADRKRIYLWPAVAVAAAILLMVFSSQRETKTDRTVAQSRIENMEMKNIQSEDSASIVFESRQAESPSRESLSLALPDDVAPPEVSAAVDDFASQPTLTLEHSLRDEPFNTPPVSTRAVPKQQAYRRQPLKSQIRGGSLSSSSKQSKSYDAELVSKAERFLSFRDKNEGSGLSPIYFALATDGKIDLRQQLEQITQGQKTELLELVEIEEIEDFEPEKPSDEAEVEFSEAEVEQPYSQRLTTLRVFELRGSAAMRFPQVVATLKGVSSYAGPLEAVEPDTKGGGATFAVSKTPQNNIENQSAEGTSRPVRLIFVDSSGFPVSRE
ncbi:MAG: RseA family anti-sigma factor [Pirellulales bacterium]|nr:RseA family anti-sigma factor [Pirellulales bacterium]